ncbi:MAG TPA: NAD(P)H-dependent oxidoreductase subunit E [Actinomycetota bacterium]
MDLHLMEAAPTADERAAVDALLGPPETGWEGAGRRSTEDLRVVRGGHEAREQRHLLLPTLHALQAGVGWISRGGLNYVCQRLSVPPAEAYGVATFYAMFSVESRPGDVVHVCDDLACRTGGALELCAQLDEVAGHEGADAGGWTWRRSPCLGMCEQAPAVFAQRAGRPEVALGGATIATVESIVAPDSRVVCAGGAGTPQASETASRPGLRLLRRAGMADPGSLDDYRANGGSEALAAAIRMGPEAVVQVVTDAKLLGRGGAAFPTGVKWKAVADQAITPHFVICNADESEPGTFKDRVLMEEDPFAVIEALTIAGFATGSERGFLYLRGEYPLAHERLHGAIEQARAAGLLGPDVMGAGFAFDVELRRGAGAYICGEETALFNSIEGKRGEPRNKPPFPVTFGVFGKPTAINNVETLVNVLEILRIGAPAYAAIGTEGSTGPRLFCVSGHVERPGVYEHEHGITLREVIEAAGGVKDGRSLKAVLLGGAAGGFVGPADLEARMTFEDARVGGYTLGSGVVMVFDEGTDLVDLCLRIARFFRDESCGQCVPCRVGTVRQEEAIHRLASGRTIGSPADEVALLGEIAAVMRDASICGLGQTAANAVQSAISRLAILDGRTA